MAEKKTYDMPGVPGAAEYIAEQEKEAKQETTTPAKTYDIAVSPEAPEVIAKLEEEEKKDVPAPPLIPPSEVREAAYEARREVREAARTAKAAEIEAAEALQREAGMEGKPLTPWLQAVQAGLGEEFKAAVERRAEARTQLERGTRRRPETAIKEALAEVLPITPITPSPEVAARIERHPENWRSYLTEEQLLNSGYQPGVTLTQLVQAGAPLAAQLEFSRSFTARPRIPPPRAGETEAEYARRVEALRQRAGRATVGMRSHTLRMAGELKEYEELKGEVQFEKAVELGFVPEGSEYVPLVLTPEDEALLKREFGELNREEQEQYLRAKEVKEGAWSYISPEAVRARVEFEAELKETSPELYAIYEAEGYDAYKKAYETQLAAYQKVYEDLQRKIESGEIKEVGGDEYMYAEGTGTSGVISREAAEYGAQEYERQTGKKITPEAYAEPLGGIGDYAPGFNDLPVLWQEYVMEHGITALGVKIESIRRLLEREGYGSPEGEYDLWNALREGKIPRDSLKFFFGKESIDETLALMVTERVIPAAGVSVPTPEVPEMSELALGPYLYKLYKDEMLFPWQSDWNKGKAVIDKAVAMIRELKEPPEEWAGLDWEKRGYDPFLWKQFVEPLALMNIGAFGAVAPLFDPRWELDLKDRPKDDPARMLFVANWRRAAIEGAAMTAAMYTPMTWSGAGAAALRITPAIAGRAMVPRIAAQVAQIFAVGVPLSITGATIAEDIRASDLERKWDIFMSLSASQRDAQAQLAGYDKFGGLDEAQQAHVLITYSVPFGYTLTEWQNTLAGRTRELVDIVERGVDWIHENAPTPIGEIAYWGGGTVAGMAVGVAEGVSYRILLPMTLANLSDRAVEGTAGSYAKNIGSGMVSFLKSIPGIFISGPYGAGRIVGLFLFTPKSYAKFMQGLGARVQFWKYVPQRAIAQEFTTLKFPAKGLTTKQQLRIIDTLNRKLTKPGVTRATVSLYGGKWELRVRSVPYQTAVGDTLFHFTPDIRQFGKKPIRIGNAALFTSPQAAMRFGVLSAIKGVKMKHPGVVEIHLGPGQLAKFKAFKVLGGGHIELEAPIRNELLIPIPGWRGRGISSNASMGIYPIRRFIIAGGPDWKGPTLKQLITVRMLTAKETILDAVLGWHGRWQALKSAFERNPAAKRINESIKQLKGEMPELEGPRGEILHQRAAVPHPKGLGYVKPRIKGIIWNEKGEVLLVLDKSGAAYELPGGSVDVRNIIVGNKFVRLRTVTWRQALTSQVKGETALDLRNIHYLDLYLGKVNEHSLSGVRIFEATAVGTLDRIKAWNMFQRYKFGYKIPELKGAIWWKPGTKGPTVLPATIDVLSARVNTQGLVPYTGSQWLLQARDLKFADRVKAGNPVSVSDIRLMNGAEIKSLIAQRNSILKGAPLTFKEYLNLEVNLKNLTDFIMGRRKAWEIIQKKAPFTPQMEDVIRQAGLWPEYYEAATYAGQADIYLRAADVMLEDAYVGAYEFAAERAYLENPLYYATSYAAYVPAVGAALGLYEGDVMRAGDPIAEYARVLLEDRPRYAEYRPETRRPEERIVPAVPARERIVPPSRVEPARVPAPARVRLARVTPDRVTPKYEALQRVYGAPLPKYGLPYPPPHVPPHVPPYVPPHVPPRVPPPTYPPPVKPPRREEFPSGATEEERPEIPPGSITWRQGMLKVRGELRPVWKYIPPPFDQPKPITLLAPPAGARNVEMRTPRETIQMIGEGEVPENISIDLGIADIYVTDSGRNIRYEGKGLKTDIGKRIVGPEKGMSIPLGVAGLKVGTSFAEMLKHYNYLTTETAEPTKSELKAIGSKVEAEPKVKKSKRALTDFVEDRLAEMLSEMSNTEIADELRKQPEEIKTIILSHLPDRVRANVERELEEKEYIPLPGAKYAERVPSWRRVRELEAEALGEEELDIVKERAIKKIKKPKESIVSIPTISMGEIKF